MMIPCRTSPLCPLGVAEEGGGASALTMELYDSLMAWLEDLIQTTTNECCQNHSPLTQVTLRTSTTYTI